MGVSLRVFDWSRRSPETHASLPGSAASRGSTLLSAQHRSGSSRKRSTRRHSAYPKVSPYFSMKCPFASAGFNTTTLSFNAPATASR